MKQLPCVCFISQSVSQVLIINYHKGKIDWRSFCAPREFFSIILKIRTTCFRLYFSCQSSPKQANSDHYLLNCNASISLPIEPQSLLRSVYSYTSHTLFIEWPLTRQGCLWSDCKQHEETELQRFLEIFLIHWHILL